MPRTIESILETIYRASTFDGVASNIEKLQEHDRSSGLSLICLQKISSKLRGLALNKDIQIPIIKKTIRMLLELFNGSIAFNKSSDDANDLLARLISVSDDGDISHLPVSGSEVIFDLDEDTIIPREQVATSSTAPQSSSEAALDVDGGVIEDPDAHFEWVEVGGEGNCLFLSLFDQLKRRTIPLSQAVNNPHHLRQLIANHICNGTNWEKCAHIILDDQLRHAGINLNRNEIENDLLAQPGMRNIASILSLREIEQYREYLKKDGSLGDYLSIIAASNLFKVNIIVKARDGNDMIINSRYFPNKQGQPFESTIYIGDMGNLRFKSLWEKAISRASSVLTPMQGTKPLERVSSTTKLAVMAPQNHKRPEVSDYDYQKAKLLEQQRQQELAKQQRDYLANLERERLAKEQRERAVRDQRERLERERIARERLAREKQPQQQSTPITIQRNKLSSLSSMIMDKYKKV